MDQLGTENETGMHVFGCRLVTTIYKTRQDCMTAMSYTTLFTKSHSKVFGFAYRDFGHASLLEVELKG